MTQLEKNLDDSALTLIRRACDSDSTNMTRRHHFFLLTTFLQADDFKTLQSPS